MKKFITFLLFLPLFVCCKAGSDYGDAVIGIAWLDNIDFKYYTDVKTTLDDLGIKNVLLKEVIHNSLQYKDGMLFSEQVDENGILKAECAEIVKSGKFAETNVVEVMKDVSAVIFVGGEDVSPTLYANPVPWHNILQERDYNATRDVSDFLLMRYCLDNDIHILGICRGAQILGVVSGASIAQDIPTWFADRHLEYNDEHREKPSPTQSYVPHDVAVSAGSKLAGLFDNVSVIGKCPSWHHQFIESTAGTNLVVSAVTRVSGVDMAEGVERNDKEFAIGVQFHPELAYVMHLNKENDAGRFMPMNQVARFFRAFVDSCD